MAPIAQGLVGGRGRWVAPIEAPNPRSPRTGWHVNKRWKLGGTDWGPPGGWHQFSVGAGKVGGTDCGPVGWWHPLRIWGRGRWVAHVEHLGPRKVGGTDSGTESSVRENWVASNKRWKLVGTDWGSGRWVAPIEHGPVGGRGRWVALISGPVGGWLRKVADRLALPQTSQQLQESRCIACCPQ